MRSWKWKILFPVFFILSLFIVKYILWDYPISDGKRVGNLTKISKKGKFIPTWEGTIDEGSGDQLTSLFSVRDNAIGEELYNYEGRKIVMYYEQYFVGWPRDTTYNVVSWKPNNLENPSAPVQASAPNLNQDKVIDLLSKTLFCTLLGSLYVDEELYQRVKDHLKKSNLYLYKNVEKCNN